MEERTDLSFYTKFTDTIRRQIADIIVGQEEAVDMLLTCMIADGHVLFEGMPGVAKTLLARLTARLLDARFSRIQFTPDLMPSDILGTSVYNMKSGDFEMHQGPAFADVVLADEINRAPAKTQAALFEVMEERQATIDGHTYAMSPVYTIIATQNPVEQEGTYRLPEAQLDRFMMKIEMGYPSVDDEVEILRRHNDNAAFARLADMAPVMTKDMLADMRRMAEHVHIDISLLRYIAQIVDGTRQTKDIYVGASPRAAIAMMLTSKAYALLQGRDFVVPDDIKTVTPHVLCHRLMLTAEAEMEGLTPHTVIKRIVEQVEVPK